MPTQQHVWYSHQSFINTTVLMTVLPVPGHQPKCLVLQLCKIQ